MIKKVALPVVNGKLSEHFGHARLFQFFEIEDNEIINSQAKEPPHTKRVRYQDGWLPKR